MSTVLLNKKNVIRGLVIMIRKYRDGSINHKLSDCKLCQMYYNGKVDKCKGCLNTVFQNHSMMIMQKNQNIQHQRIIKTLLISGQKFWKLLRLQNLMIFLNYLMNLSQKYWQLLKNIMNSQFQQIV